MTSILLSWMELGQSWCFDTIHKYVKPGKKVAVVPFGFRDAEAPNAYGWDSLYSVERGIYYELNNSGFTDHGVKTEDIFWIDYYRTSREIAQNAVKSADIVYLIGGLPDRACQRIEEFGLKDIIRHHKGVVMGYSAGALEMLEKYPISPDSDYPEYKSEKGLDRVRGFGIEVQFLGLPHQMSSIRRFMGETGLPVYAISDDGLIVVENDKVSVVGNVTFLEP